MSTQKKEKLVPFPVLNALFDAVFLAVFLASAVWGLWVLFLSDTVPHWRLFSFITIFAVAAFLYVSRKVMGAAGVWFSSHILKNAPFNDPLSVPKARKKYDEQMWQFLAHVIFTIWEWCIILPGNYEWFETPRIGLAYFTPAESHKPALVSYYIVQLVFWIEMGVTVRFIESRKRDFVIMFFHHIVTISLVSGSLYMGIMPFGFIVFILHDFTDIPIDCIVIAESFKLVGKAAFYSGEIMYAVNLVTWVIGRLTLIPIKALYPHLLLPATSPLRTQAFGYWLLVAVELSALYVLHIWWFWLLLSIAMRQVRGKQNLVEAGGEIYFDGKAHGAPPLAAATTPRGTPTKVVFPTAAAAVSGSAAAAAAAHPPPVTATDDKQKVN